MGVFSYKMVKMVRVKRGSKGGKEEGYILGRAIVVWEEGGNWDSPGKGKPQGFKYCITHY